MPQFNSLDNRVSYTLNKVPFNTDSKYMECESFDELNPIEFLDRMVEYCIERDELNEPGSYIIDLYRSKLYNDFRSIDPAFVSSKSREEIIILYVSETERIPIHVIEANMYRLNERFLLNNGRYSIDEMNEIEEMYKKYGVLQ